MASTARIMLLRRVSPDQKQLRVTWNNNQHKFCIVRYNTSSSHSAVGTSSPLSTAAAISQPPQQQQQQAEEIKTIKSASASKAYADLAKARLSALVVSTTACGFLAAGGPFSPTLLSACVVGTALCSSSAAAWNQIFEVDRDKRMKRTQTRPLVIASLTTRQAQTAATLWGVGGVSLLYVGTDPTTALLGASNIALYSGLYTWMKPRSIYNTWVGAVVGAIPPVMGWSAATGGSLMDMEALLLGSTLYLWQMPHFFALSYMYREDYARGGFAMVPVLEENGDRTAQLITRYAAYLSTIPFVATLSGVTSSMFALEGIALNAYALHAAHKFSRDRTNANARKIFLTSLWYLPCFMMLFLLHSKVWDEEEDELTEKDAVREWISSRVHSIREAGRQVCIHEKAIIHNSNDKHMDEEANKQACPVTVGTQKAQVLKRRATEAAAVAVATASDAASRSATPETQSN